MALSNILAGDIVTEKLANQDFSDLSTVEQFAKISSAQDEIANIYKSNNRQDYMSNNLTIPLPVVQTGVSVRRGVANASIAGLVVTFSSPIAQPYLLDLTGYKAGKEFAVSFFDPNTGFDTRTTNGFTAFSDEDGVIVEYRVDLPM